MKSEDELREKLMVREREFILYLAPFVLIAIALLIVIIGTISIGEVTTINFILGAVGVVSAMIARWKLGPHLGRAHRRFRKTQAKLELLQSTSHGTD